MALFSSPTIKKNGNCRWFLTMAPSDKYENRTFEVIQDSMMDYSITAWEQRTLKVGGSLFPSRKTVIYHTILYNLKRSVFVFV
jgi:hypothetical protein